MKQIELQTFKDLMRKYSDMLGNAGCNDFELPNTKDGWSLAKEISRWHDQNILSPNDALPVSLIQYDWMLLKFLLSKVYTVLEQECDW